MLLAAWVSQLTPDTLHRLGSTNWGWEVLTHFHPIIFATCPPYYHSILSSIPKFVIVIQLLYCNILINADIYLCVFSVPYYYYDLIRMTDAL